jgi:hypothetical protein
MAVSKAMQEQILKKLAQATNRRVKAREVAKRLVDTFSDPDPAIVAPAAVGLGAMAAPGESYAGEIPPYLDPEAVATADALERLQAAEAYQPKQWQAPDPGAFRAGLVGAGKVASDIFLEGPRQAWLAATGQDEALERQRQRLQGEQATYESLGEQRPWSTLGGEILGYTGVAAPALFAAPETLVGWAALGGGTGLFTGGMAPSLEEGPILPQRAQQAAIEGGLGAVMGPLFPWLGERAIAGAGRLFPRIGPGAAGAGGDFSETGLSPLWHDPIPGVTPLEQGDVVPFLPSRQALADALEAEQEAARRAAARAPGQRQMGVWEPLAPHSGLAPASDYDLVEGLGRGLFW